MCLAGAVAASWSLTQHMAGSNPFTMMTNIFVTEFSETFRENTNIIGSDSRECIFVKFQYPDFYSLFTKIISCDDEWKITLIAFNSLIISMNWSCVGAKYSVVVTSLVDESCVEDDQFIVGYRNGFCTDCCHKQTVNSSCNLTELEKN